MTWNLESWASELKQQQSELCFVLLMVVAAVLHIGLGPRSIVSKSAIYCVSFQTKSTLEFLKGSFSAVV